MVMTKVCRQFLLGVRQQNPPCLPFCPSLCINLGRWKRIRFITQHTHTHTRGKLNSSDRSVHKRDWNLVRLLRAKERFCTLDLPRPFFLQSGANTFQILPRGWRCLRVWAAVREDGCGFSCAVTTGWVGTLRICCFSGECVFSLSLFLSPYPKSLHPGLGGKQNGEGHSRTWSQTLATTTIVYGLFWWESSERWVSEGRGGYASEWRVTMIANGRQKVNGFAAIIVWDFGIGATCTAFSFFLAGNPFWAITFVSDRLDTSRMRVCEWVCVCF